MPAPLETATSEEVFFDDVADIHIKESVFRCTLLSMQKFDGEDRVVEVKRLAIPLSKLPDIIQKFVIVLTQAAKIIVRPPLS